MVDYIIVGAGLAGIAFAETALQPEQSVLVFDNHSSQSSLVAAGIYNPVILKRFSGLSGAQQQLDIMHQFYQSATRRLGENFNQPLPILRKFASVEEQNDWFAASDKPLLAPFLSTTLMTRQFPNVDSPFGFGEVLQTGYVNTKAFVKAYRQYLKARGMLSDMVFDYGALQILDGSISYQGIEARHIIFADGFGIRNNPFFNYLPLAGTKGELLIIHAPLLQLDVIVKSDVFIVPLGDGLYKVGATYEWTDKTEMPTEAAKSELVGKLEKLIDCPYEIISHEAGIRPTVKDRKPLIGTHPQFAQLHVLNGLGTRGVMLAPPMAALLFDHIDSGAVIPAEVDIKRFKP
jgi:glycine oxidase